MPKTLIVGEVQEGALREATLELVSFARELGGEVVSLLMGSGIQAAAEDLAKKGGGKVLVADSPGFESYTVDAYARAIQQVVESQSPDLILISNTPIGWDVAPKVAAALDAGIVSDVFKIEEDGGDLVFLRRLFNGKFDGRFRVSGSPRIATVQPGATAPYEGSDAGSVEVLEVAAESRTKATGTRKAMRSAVRWALRGRSSTRGGSRMTTRSAARVRLFSRSSISRSVSLAPSSTWWG
jgi:electron transfer flavoprotein alpha subunit